MTPTTIFTAADSNYFVQAAVLTRSISITQRELTNLIVFGNDWNKEQILKLKQIASDRVSVEVLPVIAD